MGDGQESSSMTCVCVMCRHTISWVTTNLFMTTMSIYMHPKVLEIQYNNPKKEIRANGAKLRDWDDPLSLMLSWTGLLAPS